MFTHSIHSNSFCSIIWFLLFLVLTTHSVDFLTFWWVVTPSVKTTGYIGLAPPQGKISHPISVGHSGRKTCLKLQGSSSVWISDCKHIAFLQPQSCSALTLALYDAWWPGEVAHFQLSKYFCWASESGEKEPEWAKGPAATNTPISLPQGQNSQGGQAPGCQSHKRQPIFLLNELCL